MKRLVAGSALFLCGCIEESVSVADRTFALLCSGSRFERVIVSIGTQNFENMPINCVNGPFVSDSPGCAAPNGYGRGFPTGLASLESIGTRWQDRVRLFGPVVTNSINDLSIEFVGGFQGFDGEFEESYRVSIDRLSGKMTVASDAGNDVLNCEETNPRF